MTDINKKHVFQYYLLWFLVPITIGVALGLLTALTGMKIIYSFLAGMFLSQVLLIVITGLLNKDSLIRHHANIALKILIVFLLIILVLGILIAAGIIDLRALYFKYIGHDYY